MHVECIRDYTLYERSLRLACVRAPLRCVLRRATPSQLSAAFAEVLRLHGEGQNVGLRRGCSGLPQSDLGGSHAMEEAATGLR